MRVFILIIFVINQSLGQKEEFHLLPRFWTNTGLCPRGNITHAGISNSIIANEVKINLQLIGALPNGALSSVRIHWLLELIQLIKFERNGVPRYDFTKLDKLVWWLDRRDLSLGIEFMGNPSEVFTTNASNAEFLWQDLSFQIGKRYLNRLGPAKLMKWRFESWNEPDLLSYNLLHFDTKSYAQYLHALRRGLDAAGRRPLENIHFKLYGPAGLFKKQSNHPLCWHALEMCNENRQNCPFDVLTYHRKGSGSSQEVTAGGMKLLEEIFEKFPNLISIPVANNEADPISGWSTPRDFQADVRYAVMVVSIIFDHWKAKLESKIFDNLDYISHDNAFISYHPHEFSQRTLFAHFRMNKSEPEPYYQFIHKPVYAALGMMGNLATHATDIEKNSETIRILKSNNGNSSTFLSYVAISNGVVGARDRFHKLIELNAMSGTTFSYVIEFLEYQNTDPVYVWRFFNSPPYPNSTVRMAMRRSQGPKLYSVGILVQPLLDVNVFIRSPWILHIRVCSDSVALPEKPRKLQIVPVTTNEVLLFWREKYQDTRCIVTYQAWFLPTNKTEWREITSGWHTPFLSFHFAPNDHLVQGTYMVRSVDSFARFSEFSKPKNHM